MLLEELFEKRGKRSCKVAGDSALRSAQPCTFGLAPGGGEGEGSGRGVRDEGLRWEKGSEMVGRVGAGAGELEAEGAEEGPGDNISRGTCRGAWLGFG